MKNLGIFSLVLLMVMASCRKDIEDVITITETPDPTIIEGYAPLEQIINGSVIGFVIDENQFPMANVEVKFGEIDLTTDQFGHFFLKDVNMNALGTLIKTKKEGYFNGSRRFFPIEGAKNRVKIEMIRKNFNQEFLIVEGGTFSVEGGGSIFFEPNSIQNQEGTLYNGEIVKVAAKWMNPTDLRTFDQMPGNLQGVGFSTQNQEVSLATYGMMAVELIGIEGEALNIAEGFTATLTMPIPEDLIGNAPYEIILWAYNEEYGVWHEESTATLQNGNYVGEVSHFSFWNCDIPFPNVHLLLQLQDTDGNPVNNLKVVLSNDNAGTASGYSDIDGNVCGRIPADQELTLQVFDICSDILLDTMIGPFSNDADIIIGSIPTANNTRITGTLECNGNPINNGIVVLTFGTYSEYYYIDNPSFDITTTTCYFDPDVAIIGVNAADFTQSSVFFAPSGEETNLGVIDACNDILNLEEYIYVSVNGIDVLFLENLTLVSVNNSWTYFHTFIEGEEEQVSIQFPGIVAGSYDGQGAIYEGTFSSTNNWSFPSDSTFSTFTVTEYGEIGEVVKGTFEGVLPNSGFNPPFDVFVSGSFKIIRQE